MSPFAQTHYAIINEILLARQTSTATQQEVLQFEESMAKINRFDEKRLLAMLLRHPDSSEHVRRVRSMISRGVLGPHQHEYSTPILCAWIRIALPRHGCSIRGDRFGDSGCLYRDPLEGGTIQECLFRRAFQKLRRGQGIQTRDVHIYVK